MAGTQETAREAVTTYRPRLVSRQGSGARRAAPSIPRASRMRPDAGRAEKRTSILRRAINVNHDVPPKYLGLP